MCIGHKKNSFSFKGNGFIFFRIPPFSRDRSERFFPLSQLSRERGSAASCAGRGPDRDALLFRVRLAPTSCGSVFGCRAGETDAISAVRPAPSSSVSPRCKSAIYLYFSSRRPFSGKSRRSGATACPAGWPPQRGAASEQKGQRCGDSFAAGPCL